MLQLFERNSCAVQIYAKKIFPPKSVRIELFFQNELQPNTFLTQNLCMTIFNHRKKSPQLPKWHASCRSIFYPHLPKDGVLKNVSLRYASISLYPPWMFLFPEGAKTSDFQIKRVWILPPYVL